jgi:hypothetical protein
MKILIKESQYKVLLEQSNPNIQKAYNEIVSGAKYFMGTDKNKILKAFDYIKNTQDFGVLRSMFEDKKTGYKSFEEMINKVFDSNDIEKVKTKLRSIGIVFNFDSDKYPYLQQVPKACSSKWLPLLEKAKNYWIQWLSNPITKKKFLDNWKKVEKNMTSVEVENIFKKYINSLNNLKLYYFDSKLLPENSNDFAFVYKYEPEKIFVNCSQNNPNSYGTLIHEIQHMLYNIKPLNPAVQIASVFVDSNTKLSTINTFFDFYKNQKSNQSKELNPSQINYASTRVGTTNDTLYSLLSRAKYNEKARPGYSCRETEKMSNITTIRNLFNIKPGQNITEKMLLPYIEGTKNDTNVSWILFCWALKGFQDLNGMLNKINQLAYQNTNQNNDSNTRTV